LMMAFLGVLPGHGVSRTRKAIVCSALQRGDGAEIAVFTKTEFFDKIDQAIEREKARADDAIARADDVIVAEKARVESEKARAEAEKARADDVIIAEKARANAVKALSDERYRQLELDYLTDTHKLHIRGLAEVKVVRAYCSCTGLSTRKLVLPAFRGMLTKIEAATPSKHTGPKQLAALMLMMEAG